MHCELDALDNFLESKDEEVQEGSLSVVVPMDDMTQILTQLWKSRQTEPKVGELYEKYKHGPVNIDTNRFNAVSSLIKSQEHLKINSIG